MKKSSLQLKMALFALEMLNPLAVRVLRDDAGNYAIIAYKSPQNIRYPIGWNYVDGAFTSKRAPSLGNEIIVLMPNGHCWNEFVS